MKLNTFIYEIVQRYISQENSEPCLFAGIFWVSLQTHAVQDLAEMAGEDFPSWSIEAFWKKTTHNDLGQLDASFTNLYILAKHVGICPGPILLFHIQ